MRARMFYMVPALWCLATPSLAAGPELAAAETNVTLGAGFAQSSYSEHLTPGSGAIPALAAGVALLLPAGGNFDYYAALSYHFSGGGQSAFNAAEARLGGGLPLRGGSEIIPYLAAGYQSANLTGGGNAASYSSPLAGAGTKLDMPLTGRLVVRSFCSWRAAVLLPNSRASPFHPARPVLCRRSMWSWGWTAPPMAQCMCLPRPG